MNELRLGDQAGDAEQAAENDLSRSFEKVFYRHPCRQLGRVISAAHILMPLLTRLFDIFGQKTLIQAFMADALFNFKKSLLSCTAMLR